MMEVFRTLPGQRSTAFRGADSRVCPQSLVLGQDSTALRGIRVRQSPQFRVFYFSVVEEEYEEDEEDEEDEDLDEMDGTRSRFPAGLPAGVEVYVCSLGE